MNPVLYIRPYTAECALQFTIVILIYYPYRLKPTNEQNVFINYTFHSNTFMSNDRENPKSTQYKSQNFGKHRFSYTDNKELELMSMYLT